MIWRRYCIASAFRQFRLKTSLVTDAVVIVTVSHEHSHASEQCLRVEAAVELLIASCLEAEEEQHQLFGFQPRIECRYRRCREACLLNGGIFLQSQDKTHLYNLWHKPFLR